MFICNVGAVVAFNWNKGLADRFLYDQGGFREFESSGFCKKTVLFDRMNGVVNYNHLNETQYSTGHDGSSPKY